MKAIYPARSKAHCIFRGITLGLFLLGLALCALIGYKTGNFPNWPIPAMGIFGGVAFLIGEYLDDIALFIELFSSTKLPID